MQVLSLLKRTSFFGKFPGSPGRKCRLGNEYRRRNRSSDDVRNEKSLRVGPPLGSKQSYAVGLGGAVYQRYFYTRFSSGDGTQAFDYFVQSLVDALLGVVVRFNLVHVSKGMEIVIR